MAEQKAAKREARRKGEAKGRGGRPRGRPFSLTTGWTAVLFALLVALFFHEVFLGGKTFTSPDTIAPVGFVRMGEKALYEEHTYPLWNPYVFLGMPSFASGAYNPLIYPPDWPLALLNQVVPLPDMTWMLLYYFIGALAMFLLAREWGARPEGALLAGAAFVFAPNLVAVGSHGHGSQLVNSAYLPLMLWLAARWLRRGSIADLAFLALAGGFQLLRGHVQIAFYTWAAVALYAVFHWIGALRDPERRVAGTVRAASIAGAALLAFGLSGFYSLPLRDYAQYSIRGGSDEAGGVGMTYATQWSLGVYELPSLVFPGWVGFGNETYWGGMPFTDYPNAFVGIVAVLFAVPALLGRGGPRIFAAVLAAGSLLVAFGYHTPVYGLLYEHLPLFNKFRVPVMVVILFQLAAALALAWGWSDVLAARDDEARRARVGRVLLGLAALVAVVCIGGALTQGMWYGAYVSNAIAHSPRMPQEVAGFAAQQFAGDLMRAGLLGLIALAAAWLVVQRRVSITLATGVALAALLVELWPVSGRVMKPVIGDPPGDVMEVGRNDTVRWLEEALPASEYRIFPLDEFQSNRFAGFGIPSIGGYHAAKPRLVQDLFDAQEILANPSWQRLLNLRFILIQRQYQQIPPYMRPVYEGQTNTVLLNEIALPRATVVGRYEVVQPARAIIDSVASGRTDPAEVTFLESDPGLTLGPVDGAAARITEYGLNRVAVEVNTPGPALLRLADLWYPDWKATVDGAPAPILCADYLLRAVPVPAGEHTVVFRFESPAIRNGLALTIVSFVLILGLLWAGWRQGRRPRAPAAADGAAAGA